MDRSIRVLAGAVFALTAMPIQADDFDYELEVDYSATDISSSLDFVSPFPTFPSFTQNIDQDIDTLAVSGTWFLGGVTANEGPRVWAAFLDQASFVSFEYVNFDGSTRLRSDSSDPNFPGQNDRFSQSGDTFSLNGRYVWDSGWYADAGVSRADFSIAGDSFDGTGYALGVGKYLGSRTTLDVTLLSSDTDGEDATNFALGLVHVGGLGSSWNYSADLSVATDEEGPSDGTYSAEVLLFPSRSFGFGAGVSGAFGGFTNNVGELIGGVSETYTFLANWFPSESIGIEASYRVSDVDDGPISSSDVDGFGLNAVIRF